MFITPQHLVWYTAFLHLLFAVPAGQLENYISIIDPEGLLSVEAYLDETVFLTSTQEEA